MRNNSQSESNTETRNNRPMGAIARRDVVESADSAPTPVALPKPTKVQPTVVKVKNHNRNWGIPMIMVALVIMAAMSYIIKEHPTLQGKYPAIFWFAEFYLQVTEFLVRVGKLVLNALGDLITLIRTGTCQFGEHISANWSSIVEAFNLVLSYLV